MKRRKKTEPAPLSSPWDSDIQPAPGDLAIALALVNTYEIPTKTDRLATPKEVERWLSDGGLAVSGSKVSRDDHALLLKVRRGLRALALVHHGKKVKEEVFQDLDKASSSAKLAVRFMDSGEGRIEPADGGLNGALARLLYAVFVAGQEGRLKRLKICLASTCRRVYYDFSPNRSSRWCSARCGNRLSAKRYRRRHRNELLGSDWLFDEEI